MPQPHRTRRFRRLRRIGDKAIVLVLDGGWVWLAWGAVAVVLLLPEG